MDTSLATIYAGWQDYQRLLADAITPLDAARLDLRAAPHLWSIGMLASHIVSARAWWFHDWMGEGGPEIAALSDYDERDDLAHRTGAEIAAALEKTWSMVASCLERWSLADLDATFQRPAPNAAGERPWRDRRFIVWHVVEHDLHHGGEISFSLGMHGIPAIDL